MIPAYTYKQTAAGTQQLAFPWAARKHFITCRVLNMTQEDQEKEERVQLRKDLQTKIQAETTVKEGTGRMLTRSYDELSKVKHVLLVGAGRQKAGKEHLTTPKLALRQLPVGLEHVDPACLKITSVSLGQLGTNQTL